MGHTWCGQDCFLSMCRQANTITTRETHTWCIDSNMRQLPKEKHGPTAASEKYTHTGIARNHKLNRQAGNHQKFNSAGRRCRHGPTAASEKYTHTGIACNHKLNRQAGNHQKFNSAGRRCRLAGLGSVTTKKIKMAADVTTKKNKNERR